MSAVIAEPIDRPWPAADEVMVQVIAARYGAVAAELRRVQSLLTGPLISESGWSGSARLAFDETVRARSTLIGPIATRYEAYAVVLRRYAGELQVLRPRLAAARTRLRATGATDGPDLLALPRAEAERLWAEWDEARRRCMAGLAVAGEIAADSHRHGWAPSWLVGVGRAVSQGTGLAELSHALAELSQVLMVTGLVLAFVCPPAAGAVWAAVAVVAVCQLAIDAARRERGERVDLLQLGGDALAAVPIGRAFAEVRSAAEADAAIERLVPELRRSRLVPGGGLAAHEGTATYRGHTLLKHVGKSPAELAQRFQTESDIGWSSSFTDRQVAESAISEALDNHQAAVITWLAGGSAFLTLDPDLGWQVGTSVSRNGTIMATSKFRVVLRKEGTVLGYYIKTAYPTP
jgi:hypothetical protein